MCFCCLLHGCTGTGVVTWSPFCESEGFLFQGKCCSSLWVCVIFSSADTYTHFNVYRTLFSRSSPKLPVPAARPARECLKVDCYFYHGARGCCMINSLCMRSSKGYSSCLVCLCVFVCVCVSVCYPYSSKPSNKASYQRFQRP